MARSVSDKVAQVKQELAAVQGILKRRDSTAAWWEAYGLGVQKLIAALTDLSLPAKHLERINRSLTQPNEEGP